MIIRILLLVGVALAAANAQQPDKLTAQQVIDRIKQRVGTPWSAETVDTFKAGSPETRVTGIATTMMATFDVLERAAAAGNNLIITHEPTFYSHLDRTESFQSANDAVWADKAKFIKEHNLVVWRFHDHWHRRSPDGILEGMTRALGWQQYQDAKRPALYTFPETSVETLASEIKHRMNIRVLRVVGSPKIKVTRVAMVPGASGPASHLAMLRRDDVDVVVIGEVPEWETIEYVSDAAAQGKRKALILLGHIPSEQAGMENCAEWLKTFVKEVPVEFIPAAEPFWMPK